MSKTSLRLRPACWYRRRPSRPPRPRITFRPTRGRRPTMLDPAAGPQSGRRGPSARDRRRVRRVRGQFREQGRSPWARAMAATAMPNPRCSHGTCGVCSVRGPGSREGPRGLDRPLTSGCLLRCEAGLKPKRASSREGPGRGPSRCTRSSDVERCFARQSARGVADLDPPGAAWSTNAAAYGSAGMNSTPAGGGGARAGTYRNTMASVGSPPPSGTTMPPCRRHLATLWKTTGRQESQRGRRSGRRVAGRICRGRPLVKTEHRGAIACVGGQSNRGGTMAASVRRPWRLKRQWTRRRPPGERSRVGSRRPTGSSAVSHVNPSDDSAVRGGDKG